jgi:hypothetical protein
MTKTSTELMRKAMGYQLAAENAKKKEKSNKSTTAKSITTKITTTKSTTIKIHTKK